MTTPTTGLDVRLPARHTCRIDPARSSIEFTTRHMFGPDGVTGSFAVRKGELIVQDPTGTSSVRAVVDATSFETGDARRDAKVRSAKFLDTATHPDLALSAIGSGSPTATRSPQERSRCSAARARSRCARRRPARRTGP